MEILVVGTYSWTATNPLSQPYWKMKMVSLNNIPYMFGQLRQTLLHITPYLHLLGGENGAAQQTIFKFDTETSSWELLLLLMSKRRTAHGISLIDAEEIFQWC